MSTNDVVIATMLAWRQQGLRVALLTLIHIDGHAPYPVGSQMVVNEDGDFSGYITGGCVESALAEHAKKCIESNCVSVERYGKGSPYFDIKLPCGSGIDVLIHPSISTSHIECIARSLGQRKNICLKMHTKSGRCSVLEDVDAAVPVAVDEHDQNYYFCYYRPRVKIIVVGLGPILQALSELALMTDMDVQIHCNDKKTIEALQKKSLRFFSVDQIDDAFIGSLDTRTAFVSLFHEHDLEVSILGRVVGSKVGYVGALGSRLTQRRRVEELDAQGVPVENIKKIHGPIGLDINAKTPSHIAISIIAELITSLP